MERYKNVQSKKLFLFQSDVTQVRDEIKSLKAQLKEMGQEAKQKEAIHTKLLAEYDKMSKDLNRLIELIYLSTIFIDIPHCHCCMHGMHSIQVTVKASNANVFFQVVLYTANHRNNWKY